MTVTKGYEGLLLSVLLSIYIGVGTFTGVDLQFVFYKSTY